ncbi:hybrid sensor histidine kinase/response regulator transcription factor [Niabella hirudinis]|uniref:hybrid sensor histidine kinase/response regulator transcription factor n=1 Tax=Niabella hirudinis TaxID=1285929 RepID=UPI003EB7C051
MFKKIHSVLFFLLAATSAMAQLHVAKLGVEQGLSNETIRSIYQDRSGFMWFGTLDGLNRFDGYTFKIYRNKFGDTSSLLSDVIYGITEDQGGNLWLATRLGVCRLNRLKDDFTTVYYRKAGAHQLIRLDRDVIKTIRCDARNNLLIASELKGLMICENAAATAIQLPLMDITGAMIGQYGVQAICFDKRGRTLVFVQGKGICVLNYKSRRLELLNAGVQYVNSMLPDGDSIWLAGNDGVYTYNAGSNQVHKFLAVENARLNANLAMALESDGTRNIYIATMGGGLNVYDKITRRVRYIVAGDGREQLSSSGIYSLLVDKTSRIWIGTRRGGINIIDPGREKFVTVSHEPGNPNSLSGNFITSVCEAPNGDLLVATEDNGLNVVDTKNNRITYYKNNPRDPASLSGNNVNNITIDHLGHIWLATYTDGICRFIPASRNFKRYRTVNEKTGVENKVFNIFYEDKDHTLWAAALRRGNYFGALYRYNRAKDIFEIFDDKLSDLFSLKEDGQGNFWGGGLTDLVKIDRVSHRHQYFYIGQFIRTITDDGMGHLWLGTEGGGLVLFDRKQQKIIARYTTSEGLSNNSIFSTLQDDRGNLWLGTFNGLSKFSIKGRAFKNYYRSDGLESDQFHFNAATKLRSGAFIFGGIQGYNTFFPDSIGIAAGQVPLRFTGMVIDGKPAERVPAYISKIDGSNIAALAVPYNNAVFSIHFAALEYAVPDKISYAYMMEGWDKGWNYSGNVRTATYTHLREGRYTFRVKCTDSNGIWNNEIAIPIHVFPPWYRSWWAYLLYLAAIVLIVYRYLRYRSRQAQLQYEVDLQKLNVQKEKAEREKGLAELAREKAEHEKYAAELETERTQRALERSERETEKAIADTEREVNERRASFFTSISHEFRTPLTLIINPVKDILEQRSQLSEKEDRELEIVYRNARRMLSLTNQLLLFRREESGLDRVYPTKLNLVAVCRDVYLCFVQQAQAKNIRYHFRCDEDVVELYADKDKLEIIFYNLLSNALKYTPTDGEVTLQIINEADAVNIGIADSGPGIAAGAAEKIFEKFYQAKERGQEIKPGFGIGLYLARQFAGAHQGSIACTNREGGGALFRVHLLKGNRHFTAEQLACNVMPGQSVLQEMVDHGDGAAPLVSMVTENTGALLASEKQSILVIDDDAAIREYLSLQLHAGYQVYEAGSAEEGIVKAEKLLPDLIISDIMMGELSGIDLCKTIKENPALSHIPVILLTGTSSDALKLQGIQQGADDYIMKPFDKALLLARVGNLLKNRTSLQRYFYNAITLDNQDVKIPEKYRRFLEQCIEVVEEHLDDEEFNSKKLAVKLGMSYSAITKKVKAVSGQSLNSFIRFLRLRKAARLFIDTSYNVNEVATTVGVFDARYFREQFSKQFGMNPSEFIKKYRKPFANKYTVNKDVLGKSEE